METLEPRCLLTLIVPAFSSLPGADHTIYLDFDGHVTENTSWNSLYEKSSIVSPAYNVDGDPLSFNSTELDRIAESWARAAEDFIPFEVNVTTVDPGIEALRKSGSGDTQWGIRVVISVDTEGCGCGGRAYINSFNWSSDTPVFVHNSGGKSLAETVSHEAGHSLGLSHDGNSSTNYYQGYGSGETGWAPIMGTSFYRNVTTWDLGEYFDSNNGDASANYNKGPDDLSLITSNNGFGYRVDDHGDSLAAAMVLTTSGSSVTGSGIIETSSDVDVFTFTTGTGNVTLNVSPFTPGPNLDIKADLYDSSGVLVATSNSSSVLDAGFDLSLTAGQYYLQVDGTGFGDPTTDPPTGYSDYGSIGQYTVSGTIVDPGALPEFSIDDVTVNESDGTASFTVTLTGTITEDAFVNYTTADGTANWGSDYSSVSGMLTFNPGDFSKSIVVSIQDDSIGESLENFFVNLSSPSSGVIIADGQGQGTINDNDTNISINTVSVTEGNMAKGKKNAGNPTYSDLVFTVSLSNAVGQTVTLSYATQDGSATTANNDYQSSSGTVTFNPGETSKTISVTVVGDNDAETDETFSVILSNAQGGSLVDAQGSGTIIDDDTSDGGGGGGNNGGGNGGGPKKSESEFAPIAHADPIWFFEPIDFQSHNIGPDPNSQHGLQLSPFDGLDDIFGGSSLALVLPSAASTSELSSQRESVAEWHPSRFSFTTTSSFNGIQNDSFNVFDPFSELQSDQLTTLTDLGTSNLSAEQLTRFINNDSEDNILNELDEDDLASDRDKNDIDSRLDEFFGTDELFQLLT